MGLQEYKFTCTRDGRKIQQAPAEWLWLWGKIGPVSSFLEIGSHCGTSLLAMAAAGIIKPGGVIRSIDCVHIPLRNAAIMELAAHGFDVEGCLGDSRSPNAVAWAAQSAPYDAVFIDGDHSYEAVRSDWLNYGPMGRVVAFHDISGNQDGCVRLWKELTATHKTEEFTASPEEQLPEGVQGVGIVYNTDQAA